MLNTKTLSARIVLTGGLSVLLAASAFAENRHDSGTYQLAANHGYSNRTVEGTVQTITRERDGAEHVHLTNGMDVFVPRSVAHMSQGHRWEGTLQVGDLVRMDVFSRPGDGRDAQARAIEILRSTWGSPGRAPGHVEGRRIEGTIVSFDRRLNLLVVESDHGRMVNVDMRVYSRANSTRRFHRNERVSIAGHMDRNGQLVAEDIRFQTR